MGKFDPRKLLVATDLTNASEAAVAFAADMAGLLEAEVILFHAISPIGFVDHGLFDDDRMVEMVEGESKRVDAALHAMIADLFPPGARVRTRIASGYPISSICQTAREESVDLVIMGSHGRNVVMSFLVGSVTQGVLFSTSRPLIIVPKKRSPLDRREILSILCPINFTEIARNALLNAVQLGAKLGAEVHALHLVEPGQTSDEHELTRRLEAWIPDPLRKTCTVRVQVRHGNAAEEVIRYARSESVDLIVVGAGHKRFADFTVLGTTTERVTRHAPCPVMAVMEPKDASPHEEDRERTDAPVAV